MRFVRSACCRILVGYTASVVFLSGIVFYVLLLHAKTTTDNLSLSKMAVFQQAQDDFRSAFNIRRSVESDKLASKVVAMLKTRKPMDLLLSNDRLCSGHRVDLLVYVQSSWANFMKRRSLRSTWAGQKTFRDIFVRTVFILGKPLTEEDQIKVNNEQLVHGDIVQGNFIDSFGNLTMKSLLALEWISLHCPHARYVLKADDDIFVNVLSIMESVVPKLTMNGRSIACHVVEAGRSPIVRNSHSKWYIPNHVFPNQTVLPKFCTGYTVIMTTYLVRELYLTSYNATYFSVDDVFVFGFLLQKITAVSYIDLHANFTLTFSKGLQAYTETSDRNLIAISAHSASDMDKLWSAALMKMSSWAKQHT